LALPDVFICMGAYPYKPPLPFTPGVECTGEVVATGPGCSTPVGARIMGVASFFLGTGAFAAETNVREQSSFAVPDGMVLEEAATFTVAFHTAYAGLVLRAGFRAGETVLVHGATGGTGAAALQLAKALGARTVATARGATNAATARDLGADLAIDLTAEDFVAAVRGFTGGRGADIVYDPVGGDVFERSLGCLAHQGRILPIGYACGRWGNIQPETITRGNISVIGAVPSGFPRADMLAMHAKLLQLRAAGSLRLDVDRTIPFADIPQGLQDIADRRVRGRVVALH
jgi:NADPH2:quinone reductase